MVVYADEINRGLAQTIEQVLHGDDSRAGGNEVIEDDDVLLRGYVVGGEDGIDTLAGVEARVFTEDRTAVGDECHRRLGIGDGFDRGKRKIHISAFCCKDMDERGSGKRRGGVYKQWNTLLITQNYGLEIHGNSCAVTCIVKIKFANALSMHK